MNIVSGWNWSWSSTMSEQSLEPKSGFKTSMYRSRNTQDIWSRKAREDLLNTISQLRENWDGYGAIAIEEPAITNAQRFLARFEELGFSPQFIFPSSAGTINFEWESVFGSAHMEIGNSTFGFYTSPVAGESIMDGGLFEGLNANKIGFALAGINSSHNAHSVASGNSDFGFEGWYTTRAA